MDESTTVCVPFTLHTVHIKHGWALGFLRMELVLLHLLMNAQPLHFPHVQIQWSVMHNYWHQREMLQVVGLTKYSAHCSPFHFRARKNPAQKLLLLSQQYKGMIKLLDFIVEYQLLACN